MKIVLLYNAFIILVTATVFCLTNSPWSFLFLLVMLLYKHAQDELNKDTEAEA